MNNAMIVRVSMPSEKIFEAQAKMVNIPTTSGILGILPGHGNLIAKVTVGCINVFLESKDKTELFICEGLAIVSSVEVDIVSEFAVDLSYQNRNNILQKISNLYLQKSSYKESNLDTKSLEKIITRYKSLLDFISD